ncbi:hypothetical protein C0J52_19447 [Blattella germanica]|nr:hypothetical protein C0J52_19447 [Blattella germanica]
MVSVLALLNLNFIPNSIVFFRDKSCECQIFLLLQQLKLINTLISCINSFGGNLDYLNFPNHWLLKRNILIYVGAVQVIPDCSNFKTLNEKVPTIIQRVSKRIYETVSSMEIKFGMLSTNACAYPSNSSVSTVVYSSAFCMSSNFYDALNVYNDTCKKHQEKTSSMEKEGVYNFVW